VLGESRDGKVMYEGELRKCMLVKDKMGKGGMKNGDGDYR